MNKPSLAVYRARWLATRTRLRQSWQGLSPREQRLLGGAGLVLSGLLLWTLLIQPPLQKIDYWQAETPRLRSQNEALDALLRDLSQAPAGQPLEQSLQQSLDASGLAARYQLSATASGSWQLTFDDAAADQVLAWLLTQPPHFSLHVIEARLQRTGAATPNDNAAGTLSGTVRMDQAQGAAKEAS